MAGVYLAIQMALSSMVSQRSDLSEIYMYKNYYFHTRHAHLTQNWNGFIAKNQFLDKKY